MPDAIEARWGQDPGEDENEPPVVLSDSMLSWLHMISICVAGWMYCQMIRNHTRDDL